MKRYLGLETTDARPYAVNLWGSQPGRDDDCWTGADFPTLDAALAAYRNPEDHDGRGWQASLRDAAWIELDGPDAHQERRLPWAAEVERRRADDDREWRREIAMEAGMLHGCAGYNEVMGY